MWRKLAGTPPECRLPDGCPSALDRDDGPADDAAMRRVLLVLPVLLVSALLASTAQAGAAAHLEVTAGGSPVSDGATATIATATVGNGTDIAVLIANTAGAGDLIVTSLALTSPGGIGWHIDPAIIQPTLPTTDPGGSGYYVYPRCLATTAGDFTGTLVITSNDPTNPSFTLHLQCHVDAAPPIGPPSMGVQWGSSPDLANGATVDFGTVVRGAAAAYGVVVRNHAHSDPLHVASVTVVGDAEIAWQVDPVVVWPAFPLTIPANVGNTFPLLCNATTLGLHQATVTIVSDDPQDSTFVLHVTCNVLAQAPNTDDLPPTGAGATSTAELAGLLVMVGVALRLAGRRRRTTAA